MPFRPAPLPTAFVAVGLIILGNLSAWQYGRHVASGAQREVVHRNLYGTPAVNADLGVPADALAWRKAVLTGHFDDARAALVTGRFEFGEPGFDVVVPFQVDGGPVLLVNRGWIPANGWSEAIAAVDTHGATTTVEGLLLPITGPTDLPSLPAGDGRPERWPQETNTVAGCAVGRLGPPYATLAARLSPVPDVVMIVGPPLTREAPKSRDSLPVGGYVPEPKEIGHLEYSAQWALIGATLLAVWTYAGFRRGARTA